VSARMSAQMSAQMPAEAPPRASERMSAQMPARVSAEMPIALPRSRLPTVLLTLITRGALGAAGYFYLQWRERAAASPPAPPAIAMPVTTLDAPAAQPAAPPPVTPPPAVAVDAGAAVDVAEDAAAPAHRPPTRPDTPPPPPKKDPSKDSSKDPVKDLPRGGGPPGYITIDSSPMYSVIFIDGKRYGETPLVQISLPSGKHTVRAVSPSGASRTMTIVIEPGKVAQTRRIEW